MRSLPGRRNPVHDLVNTLQLRHHELCYHSHAPLPRPRWVGDERQTMRNPVLIALTSGGSIPLRPAAIALAALALVPVGRVHARPLSQPALWTTLAPAMTPAAGWTLRGLAAGPDGRLHLAPSTAPLACASADIDGGIASYDPAAGLCAGRDPYAAGSYGGRNYYNGARFHYGTLLSPPMSAAPFDQAIAS